MEINHSNNEEIISMEIEQKFNRRFEGWKLLYIRRIRRGLVYHHTSQLSILFGSALVPLLLTISSVPRLVPTVVSGIVLVASALSTYYRFSERLRHLQQTLDTMIEEEVWKDLRTGPYQNLDRQAAFAHFAERITKIIQKQNTYSYTYGDARKSLSTKELVVDTKSS